MDKLLLSSMLLLSILSANILFISCLPFGVYGVVPYTILEPKELLTLFIFVLGALGESGLIKFLPMYEFLFS